MFAFKLWSHFGAFRDPITITQNVTLSIPPKTTIGGMLAAILGMDYNEYFENHKYFDFGYSLVLINPIRKRSFAQNYVLDYTKESLKKHKDMLNALQKYKILRVYKKKMGFLQQPEFFEDQNYSETISDEKLVKKENDFKKALAQLNKKFITKMQQPKPIWRELLINPCYMIFIKDFEFEDEIIELLKKHNTGFALYMGNSEFAANYEFIECSDYCKKPMTRINSFTKCPDMINFEPNIKYTTVYSATKTVESRKYKDYQKIIISNKTISYKSPINSWWIKTERGEFNCEFI